MLGKRPRSRAASRRHSAQRFGPTPHLARRLRTSSRGGLTGLDAKPSGRYVLRASDLDCTRAPVRRLQAHQRTTIGRHAHRDLGALSRGGYDRDRCSTRRWRLMRFCRNKPAPLRCRPWSPGTFSSTRLFFAKRCSGCIPAGDHAGQRALIRCVHLEPAQPRGDDGRARGGGRPRHCAPLCAEDLARAGQGVSKPQSPCRVSCSLAVSWLDRQTTHRKLRRE